MSNRTKSLITYKSDYYFAVVCSASVAADVRTTPYMVK